MASQWYYHSLFQNISINSCPNLHACFCWSSCVRWSNNRWFLFELYCVTRKCYLDCREMRCACLLADKKNDRKFCPVMSKWRCIRKRSHEEVINRARFVSQMICCSVSYFPVSCLPAPWVCRACISHPTKANTAQICCSMVFYMAWSG